MPTQPGDRQSDQSITSDLACANCGYNLRTLAADARCPECGWEVARTLAAPPGGGTRLLIAAFALATLPWFLARPLAALVPIREGVGTVAILFGAATVSAMALLFIGRRTRRKRGRCYFGRSGLAAMIIAAAFAIAGVTVSSFCSYLARDTTVYAPGFNPQVFLSIQTGTPRTKVERLIGPGLQSWTDAASGDRFARYSRRAGFLGWKHIVQYGPDDRVKSILCTRTAD